MDRQRAITYILLTISMALWGGTWIAGRVLAQSMTPVNAALLRFALASAFLVIACRMTTGKLPRLTWKQLPGTLALGATGVFLYSLFFFNGLKTITAGRAALIVACIPACISALSAILYKEHFGPLRILGTLLSLAGVAVVISDGDPLALIRDGIHVGDLLILGCVASWTAYTLCGRQVMKSMHPVSAVTWSCVFGMLMLLPVALLSGLVTETLSASPLDWLCLVFLGTLATGLAYLWYYNAIKTLGASRAAIFINLVPVFAVALGALLLAEPVHTSLVIGGATVITGVWLTNRP